MSARDCTFREKSTLICLFSFVRASSQASTLIAGQLGLAAREWRAPADRHLRPLVDSNRIEWTRVEWTRTRSAKPNLPARNGKELELGQSARPAPSLIDSN